MGIDRVMGLGRRAALAFAMVLAFSALGTSVYAAESQEVPPERLALARQYVDLTDSAGIYEGTLVQTAVNTMRTITKLNPELAKPANDAIEKVLAGYKARKGELLDQFARVYALNFTDDELKQIVAFYQSDVGKKVTKTSIAVNTDLQKVMQVFDANLQPEFYAKVRAQLKADGYNL
jgi:hypothetical protein